MFERELDERTDVAPHIFRKKVYGRDRLGRDARWLLGHLDRIWDIYGRQVIDDRLRELVMVAVARENQCRHCSFMHTEWARQIGAGDALLEDGLGIDDEALDEAEAAAVTYARRRAAADFEDVDGEDIALLVDHFSARQRRAIEATARGMAFANLVANTWDALHERIAGRPIGYSDPVAEAVCGLLFAVGSPAAGVMLAVMRREGPVRLLEDFGAFSERFEQHLLEESS